MEFNPSNYERMKFEEEYAKLSGVKVAYLHSQGLHAYPCDCDRVGCQGWVMLEKWQAEDKRKLGQIKPGYHVDYGPDFEKSTVSILMPGDTFIGIMLESTPEKAFTLEQALTNLEDFVWTEVHAILFPLFITMPCGKDVVYEKREDFPKQTVPCPCGNPKHTLVLIEGLKAESDEQEMESTIAQVAGQVAKKLMDDADKGE